MEQQNSMQFFNSFVESIQNHCQNHLLFNKFVEIGGYISVEIDNMKKERYVLSELIQSSGNVVSESFRVKAFTACESNPTSCVSRTRKSIPPQRRRSEERFGGSGLKYRKLEDHGQHLQSQQDSRVPGSPDSIRYCQLKSPSWDQDTQSQHPSSDYCSGEAESVQTQSTTSHTGQYIQGNVQTFHSESLSEHDSRNKFSGQNDIQEINVTFPCTEPEDEISDTDSKGDADVIDVDLLNDDLDPSADLGAPDIETFPLNKFYRDSANPDVSQVPHTTGETSSRYGCANTAVASCQPRKKLSPGTIYTVRSGVNIFKKYHLNKSGIDIDLFSTPPERMNELILDYFQGARKMNGGELSYRSLKNVQERLDMFLADGGYLYSLRKDARFVTSNEYLQQVMGERMKQPATTYVHITNEDIEALFNFNQIGKRNPDMLTNGMWFLNCRFFAIRRPNEHLGMKWKDISLEVDECGQEYIARRINDSLCLKRFANVENPDQCFVSLYKQFRDKRPADMCDGESPFYLKVNRLFSNQCWFLSQPMAWTNFSNIWRKMVVGASLPLNKKIF